MKLFKAMVVYADSPEFYTKFNDELDFFRIQKKSIVWTNGCFDLFHAGHAVSLYNASCLGDVLIVGLNSDASIKRLKGDSRPIIPEKERAFIVSSIRYVYAVVIFDGDTPYNIVEFIKPNIWCKGSEYNTETNGDKIFIESLGRNMIYLDTYPNVSTTKIIGRIKSS